MPRTVTEDSIFKIINDYEARLRALERTHTNDTAPAGGSGSTYVFTQNTASITWTITHGLNRYPSVTIVDTAGTEWHTTVEYVDENQIIIRWARPTAGTAFLNYS